MNPLDLTGPEFLLLYVQLAVVAVPAGYLLRRVIEGFDVSNAASRHHGRHMNSRTFAVE